MDIYVSFAIISLAALIHASFQLSVSVLTLLSSHAIGSKKSHTKLIHLTTSFVVGAGTMTVLLLSTISLLLLQLVNHRVPQIAWISVCGLLIAVALSVLLFYYRPKQGTMLWIPRGMARYLTDRTKSTKLGGEAFGLGLSSVFGELLFIIAPLTVSALVLIQLSPVWQITGIIVYTLVSLLPLLIVWALVGSGHNLSRIQKWRENNKKFLQYASGMGLIILSGFVYVFQIIEAAASGFLG